MKIIRVRKDRSYTSHGIGYTDHKGYGGTSDNRWSCKMAISYELARNIGTGEQYQVEINGVNKGTFIKT